MLYLACCQIRCYTQKATKVEEVKYHQNFIPCFISEVPKVINLPDSFQFKEKNYFAIFHVTVYFDSLGNTIEIIPFQLSIKNKITKKVINEFIYRKGWEDSAINITKVEAMRYVIWAEKALPLVTKLKRYPSNIKCNEKITNRIGRALEYRLE